MSSSPFVNVDELRKQLRENIKRAFMEARPPWRWWFTKSETAEIDAEVNRMIEIAKSFNAGVEAETFTGPDKVEVVQEEEDELPALPWLE